MSKFNSAAPAVSALNEFTHKDKIMGQAFAAWIDLEEERTIEALVDVDAGQVIDHQSVQAWADSLESDKPLPVPH
jgi:predicted transcriptional regulator